MVASVRPSRRKRVGARRQQRPDAAEIVRAASSPAAWCRRAGWSGRADIRPAHNRGSRRRRRRAAAGAAARDARSRSDSSHYCWRARPCRSLRDLIRAATSRPQLGARAGKRSCRIWNGHARHGLVRAQWRSGRATSGNACRTVGDGRRAPSPLAAHRRASSRLALLLLLVVVDRGRVDRAAADRDPFPQGRVRAARSTRRAITSTASAFAPRRSATSSSAIPSGPTSSPRHAHHPDAAEVGRQLRGLSHRRARRPAARPAGPRQGQLGPDRQAAAAAERTSRSSCPTSSLDVADSSIALATPFGPVGVALEGNGKLSGGFKGHAARRQPARWSRAAAPR